MKLHYRLQPALRDDGRPPVVLLHGLFGSLDNLGVLARPLREHHATLQVDLRNHGLSPHDADAGYGRPLRGFGETRHRGIAL